MKLTNDIWRVDSFRSLPWSFDQSPCLREKDTVTFSLIVFTRTKRSSNVYFQPVTRNCELVRLTRHFYCRWLSRLLESSLFIDMFSPMNGELVTCLFTSKQDLLIKKLFSNSNLEIIYPLVRVISLLIYAKNSHFSYKSILNLTMLFTGNPWHSRSPVHAGKLEFLNFRREIHVNHKRRMSTSFFEVWFIFSTSHGSFYKFFLMCQ